MTLDFRNPPELTLFPETTGQDVMQNLYCIINTVLGNVPLLRDYGLDMTFIDMPRQEAQVMLIAAIADAVRKYEPRCMINEITFADEVSEPEHLYPIVEVTINE